MVEDKLEPRIDRSAVERLVHGFGLLLLKGDFERYLVQQSEIRDGWGYTRCEQNLHRFAPLLPYLDIEVRGRHPEYHHLDELVKMQNIEAFLLALKLTVDFSLDTSELHKRLKKKFNQEPHKPQVTYRTKQLINSKLLSQCYEVRWIIDEFHHEYDHQNAHDTDIWSAIIKADSLHRDTGLVSREFYQHLARYQSSRGGGKPRKYLRTALAVLLAEYFVTFGQSDFKPQIHDRSEPADIDPYGVVLSERDVKYESAFADFLRSYIQVIGFIDDASELEKSLDHFRKILRLRVNRQIPSISHYLRSSLSREEVSEIVEILDRLKF